MRMKQPVLLLCYRLHEKNIPLSPRSVEYLPDLVGRSLIFIIYFQMLFGLSVAANKNRFDTFLFENVVLRIMLISKWLLRDDLGQVFV